MENKNRQHASTAILIAALLMFVGFHFFQGFGFTKHGWEAWVEIGRLTQNPRQLMDMHWHERMRLAAFLNFSLLIVASPFLKNVWPKSRLVWGAAVFFSGLAATPFLLVYAIGSIGIPGHRPGVGGVCLLLAPVTNLVGLLLAMPKFRPRSSTPFQ